MVYVATLFVPPFVALATGVACTWLWRASLPRPFVFATFAFLALLGLHRIFQAAWDVCSAFIASGYFLEGRGSASLFRVADRQLTLEALAVSILVVLGGVPLLFLLRELTIR